MENDSNKETQGHSEEEVSWEEKYLNEYDEEWERTKKQNQKRRSMIIKIGSSLIIFTLLISGLQIWFNLFNIPAIEFVKTSHRLSQDPVISQYKNSVVTIEWEGVKGTGFNIDSTGLIITNNHVVNHTKKVNVYFNSGEPFIGTVIATSPEYDLALVDIEADSLPILSLSHDNNWNQSIGEKIIFIGNPLSFTQIANEGTVAGEVLLQDWNVPVMMIDAPIYKGNSGSPVINEQGEVIGVVFATISAPEGKKRVGVATPIQYLMDILEKENEL